MHDQEREKALALRLLDLQEMVATKLGMKSLDQLQETAAATSTSGINALCAYIFYCLANVILT